MAEDIAKPVFLEGLGGSACADCRGAPYITFYGARVDICLSCQQKLIAMGEEHPERIFAYDSLGRRWFYTEGVKPGPDANNVGVQAKGGDVKIPYIFGVRRAEDYFGPKVYLSLLNLRSKIQDQRIAAHRPADLDGF
jgi:hypothetical protein